MASSSKALAEIIDLRSDTVTHPTPEMYAAIRNAELGDDGHGDDPTVKRLEQAAAERLGKHSALFVPSGTMGNLLALLSHGERGDRVIAEENSHVLISELGGMSSLASLYPHPVPGRRGRMDLGRLETLLSKEGGAGIGKVGLVWLENTHTASGGCVLDRDYCEAVASLAVARGIRVHLDGARLFNAATALNETPATLARGADSVMIALSKGLSAPVGSLLCGSAALIARARAFRKMLGGTLRQSGILAAAGLVALQEGTFQLSRDHGNARHLAARFARIDEHLATPEDVETNILLADVSWSPVAPEAWREALRERGILCGLTRTGRLRFVTHRHHDVAQIERVSEVLAELVHQYRRAA